MVKDTVLQAVCDRVEQCYCIAEETLDRSFPRPAVSFNQRGRIAGSARLLDNAIRLNPALLEDNFTVFIEEVIPHEICHLLVYQLHGKVRPHGHEWRTLMQSLFQLPGKTTHNMDTHRVEGRTFAYHCACGEVRLSVRRHNKVKREQARYLCRRCGNTLLQVSESTR